MSFVITHVKHNDMWLMLNILVLTFFARVTMVTRFTDTDALLTMTLQGVLLDTVTLFRAARPKSPLRTS